MAANMERANAQTTAISEEEFCRLQAQLLELRNRNYELMEENQRQRNLVAMPTKSAEALMFATKLVSRREEKENEKLEAEVFSLQSRLCSQEEEFRLQQSTLFSELNEVIKQCELLEKQSKENAEKSGLLRYQGIIVEKDSTISNLKKVNEELAQAKSVVDEQNALFNEMIRTLDVEGNSLKAKCECLDVALRDKDEQLEKLTKEKDELLKSHKRVEVIVQTNETMENLLIQQKLDEVRAELSSKLLETEEKVKAEGDEMIVALKKQSSMPNELRRQVQAEKRRAEQAEEQLEVVSAMHDASGLLSLQGSRLRVGGSPSSLSDRLKKKSDVEAGSSVCSWAFVTESDENSITNFDGDDSSCSASIFEADYAELVGRYALLQKKLSEASDRLAVALQENSVLQKEVSEKNEVIAEWIRASPDKYSSGQLSNSPGLRIRRMLDLVRVDVSAADIRDMNRRLQRMLEEALSKNLILQKVMQMLLEKSIDDKPSSSS